MEDEVNRVPATRIGQGAQPGPNDGTKGFNPVPTFPGGDRGRDPGPEAMKSEVNSVRKGSGNSKGSKGTDFAQKRDAIRKKK
jgi:hypothetical protein